MRRFFKWSVLGGVLALIGFVGDSLGIYSAIFPAKSEGDLKKAILQQEFEASVEISDASIKSWKGDDFITIVLKNDSSANARNILVSSLLNGTEQRRDPMRFGDNWRIKAGESAEFPVMTVKEVLSIKEGAQKLLGVDTNVSAGSDYCKDKSKTQGYCSVNTSSLVFVLNYDGIVGDSHKSYQQIYVYFED